MELKKRYYIIDTEVKSNKKVIKYGYWNKEGIVELFDKMEKEPDHIYHIVWSTSMSGYTFYNGIIERNIWKDLDNNITYHIVK